MSSVFARQLDSDGLSRRWFAAFAGAVRLIRLPCGKLRHPASAAASRQSVDLFFVGARHDAAFVRFRYLHISMVFSAGTTPDLALHSGFLHVPQQGPQVLSHSSLVGG